MRGALALAALLAAAGCAPEPHEARVPVRLRAEPAEALAAGDSLRTTAWLVNPTREPLRMEFDDQCQVEVYVQGPDRTVVHPPGGGASCVGAPSELEIAPGDSLRFDGAWLAPGIARGDHIAYAVLWAYHVPHEGGRAAREGHRSNVIQFRVLPPE